jgi:hypothetical protein
MAARDVYHQAVRNGLVKDQWRITDDPLLLQVGGGVKHRKSGPPQPEQIAKEIKDIIRAAL